jgi:Lon protease-like protein
MAMFPLGVVLFPHARLALHVFEPRYRLMTRRVLRGDGEFGVVLIERGSEVGGGDARFDVGTVARVVGVRELPDGGYALGTVGVRRVRVARWLPDDPFPQAEVADLSEPVPASAVGAELRLRAVEALREVCALYRRSDPQVPEPPVTSDNAVQASYELAAWSPIGPLDAQRVLETAGAGDRLVLLAALLDEHARMLRAQ